MNIYDLSIEEAVIGEILIFEGLKQKAVLLNDDDFSSKEHKILIGCMKALASEGKTFDFLTVANICGSDYREVIKNCCVQAVSEVLFEEHFRLLKEMSSRRRLIENFDKLVREDEVSINTVRQLADEEEGRRLTNDIKKTNDRHLDEFIAGLNKEKDILTTGFGGMDRVLGGIRRGTVFIVGARPSTGKTSFAINIAANQIKLNKKVMFFSLEMSVEMIFERLIAVKCLIDYSGFGQNTLTDEDIEKIKYEVEELKDSGKFIVVDDTYNAEQICNLISEHKPDLAVIDFMQIVSAMGRFENVRGKIDYISSLFKRTAKTCNSVIMVLSQLTRIGDAAPTMSDLKESGGLEQDGDYIALLHRPFVTNKNNPEIVPEDTELMLDKNKFGKTGKIDFYFDLKRQKFSERLPR